MFRITLHFLLLILCCGCQRSCIEFDPFVTYQINPCILQERSSAFEPPAPEECKTDWGKELRIAYVFAKEQDYYRAITAFKRAMVLLPPSKSAMKFQIEYGIFQSYYLGCKYQEAIESYEASTLNRTTPEFPAFRELLIMLYDSYRKIDDECKAQNIMEAIHNHFPEDAATLQTSSSIIEADFSALQDNSEDVDNFIGHYCCEAKSIKLAKTYQAILPGAGYYYVGQKNTAITSFLINSLFIWAAWNFFEHGNIAAGLITTSLETGWYFGGIYGAGLAANEYNERLYESHAKDFMRCSGLFPVLMLQTNF